MKLVLISGLSGSGKSIALKSLEDLGFFCTDNLPSQLLSNLIEHQNKHDNHAPLAVSIDSRSNDNFKDFPLLLKKLQNDNVEVKVLFLEARDDILIKRFSETRRSHPIAQFSGSLLEDALHTEREILYPVRENAFVIDTSLLSIPELRRRIREFSEISSAPFVLAFESFGFKYGVPADSDFVFDVRSLPNPYYLAELRDQNGYDEGIRTFFADLDSVRLMIEDITKFLQNRLSNVADSPKSMLKISIGCTGGMHRSVYITNELALQFQDRFKIIVNHRQLSYPYTGRLSK